MINSNEYIALEDQYGAHNYHPLEDLQQLADVHGREVAAEHLLRCRFGVELTKAVLEELGAIEGKERTLTPLGHQLARFPVDPRIARMILAGAEYGCLDEVLIIGVGAMGRLTGEDLNSKHRRKVIGFLGFEHQAISHLTGTTTQDTVLVTGPLASSLHCFAAVHALVLTGDAPELAAHYPSAGGDRGLRTTEVRSETGARPLLTFELPAKAKQGDGMAALEADKFLAEHAPDPLVRSIEQREKQMIGAWD